MGKWIGGNKPAGAEEWIGFLDQGVELEGTLNLSGTFRIDGHVKGTVRCKDRLIIGEKALVEGEIDSVTVTVAGKVHGIVRASTRLEITPSGVIEGEIHTPTLVLEAGGVIEGRCHMKADAKAAAPAAKGLRLTPQTQN